MRAFALMLLVVTVIVMAGGCKPKQASPTPPVAADAVAAPTQTAAAPQAAAPATESGSAGDSETDWPRFQGPYGNSLAAPQKFGTAWTTQPPTKLWEVPMGDNGYAGPASAGGKVYILDHQGQEDVVRCLDLSTGAETWTFRYAEAGGDNYGYSRATPCVSGGKVYTISRSGLVHCLDANAGQKVWSKSLAADLGGSAPQWLYAPSPIVDGKAVIVIPGGAKGAVAALDKENGAALWQGGGSDKCSYATPVPATLAGVKQYVIFGDKALFGVQANTGKQLWRVNWVTGCDVNAATPLVDGDRIIIASGYGHGCAMVQVSGSSAKIVWENKAIQAHFSSPALYQGKVYGIGDPGNLVCLDPASGKVLWQQAGFEKGGLIVAGGYLMAFQGGDGALVLAKADPSSYQEIGRFTPLGGQSWTAPIMARGKLIVRNQAKLAVFAL